jgi:hypothetical protein
MKVYCRGGTKEQKKLAKDVAKFCAEKLMTKRLAETLKVTIFFVHDLGDLEGDCGYEDDESPRPKEYSIRIRNSTQKIITQMRTICHEMVHVKQYAKGEMKELWKPARYTRYQGKVYPEKMNYWDTPWEVEAFGREVGLYTRWVDDRGLTGNELFDNRHLIEKITKNEKAYLGLKG